VQHNVAFISVQQKQEKAPLVGWLFAWALLKGGSSSAKVMGQRRGMGAPFDSGFPSG
jgi:hypothetical protein